MSRKAKTAKEYENELFNKEIDYFPVNLDTYVNTHTKIEHECLKGHIWQAEPANILRGRGCPICYGWATKLKSVDQYILDLREKNPSFTIKNKKEYINSKTKLTHTCINGHDILLSPSQALRGHGCSKCSRLGIYNSTYFKKHPETAKIQASVYLLVLTIQDIQALKLGITIDFNTRFKYYKKFHAVMLVNRSLTLSNAFELEQYLLNKYKGYKINSPIKFDGYSELLSTSIERSLIEDLEAV